MFEFLRRKPKKAKEQPVLDVVAVFRPLYERFEGMDLHAEQGLHGFDEVMGMLEAALTDPDFRYLASRSSRRVIQSIGCGEVLGVNSDGSVYALQFGGGIDSDWQHQHHDWKAVLRKRYDEGFVSADSLRAGILDYLRFGPYDDAYSHFKREG